MKKLKRVVIKEEFVALTGDVTKAIILNQFIYWSERVYDFDLFINEEKYRAEQQGTDFSIELRNGWIYKKSEELSSETMLNIAPNTMRRHIAFLVQKGWLDERYNPEKKWDRTMQYRVNLGNINNDLMAIGYILQDYKIDLSFLITEKVLSKLEYPKKENAFSKMENGSSIMEAAISQKEHANSKMDNGNFKKKIRISNSAIRTLQNGQAIPEITTEITTKNNQSIHHNVVREIDGEPQIQETTQETTPAEWQSQEIKNDPCGSSESGAKRKKHEPAACGQYGDKTPSEILADIQNRTGVTNEQIARAVARANHFDAQGKVKTNYFGLLESICKTIITEDHGKKLVFANVETAQDNKKIKHKKDLIRSLYQN